MTTDKDYYNVGEAATFLGVSPETVRRLYRQGKVRHYRLGGLILLKRDDLVALVEGGKEEDGAKPD